MSVSGNSFVFHYFIGMKIVSARIHFKKKKLMVSFTCAVYDI